MKIQCTVNSEELIYSFTSHIIYLYLPMVKQTNFKPFHNRRYSQIYQLYDSYSIILSSRYLHSIISRQRLFFWLLNTIPESLKLGATLIDYYCSHKLLPYLFILSSKLSGGMNRCSCRAFAMKCSPSRDSYSRAVEVFKNNL